MARKKRGDKVRMDAELSGQLSEVYFVLVFLYFDCYLFNLKKGHKLYRRLGDRTEESGGGRFSGLNKNKVNL